MNQKLKIWNDFLVDKFQDVFKGKKLPKLVMDFANGAGHEVAMEVLTRLGFEVEEHNTEKDGKNVNVKAGATYPTYLSEKMQSRTNAIGFAFDGDADRCIVIDEQGEIVPADKLMAAFCLFKGAKTLISTVMLNTGIQKYLEDRDIKVIRTPVGERYVVEEFHTGKYGKNVVMGESSDHLVFPEFICASDGLVLVLSTLKMIVESGKSLHETVKPFPMWPSILKNVDFEVKGGEYYQDGARVLIRKSGTERLWRILVEGDTREKCEEILSQILGSK